MYAANLRFHFQRNHRKLFEEYYGKNKDEATIE